jgi:DNA-binding transcriptional MerR regulator
MKWLSPGHTGRRLNLSTSRLAQLDREGVLRAVRDSAGRRFYDPAIVEEFARRRKASRQARVSGTTHPEPWLA